MCGFSFDGLQKERKKKGQRADKQLDVYAHENTLLGFVEICVGTKIIVNLKKLSPTIPFIRIFVYVFFVRAIEPTPCQRYPIIEW